MSLLPRQSPSVDAHLRQARQLLAGRDFAGAAALFGQAIALDPDADPALAGLGHCLNRLGRGREAVALLRQAVGLVVRRLGKGGDPAPLLDLAWELQQAGASRDSLAPIEQALKRRPDSARAHHLKALALERCADFRGGRQSAARALALAPGEANAALLLASLEARCGDLATARRRLEGLVSGGAGPGLGRALFELGRVLDRQGEATAAFSLFVRAGALNQATLGDFDEHGLAIQLAGDRRYCTREWLAALAEEAPAEAGPDPLFLMGFYRSGTTLMEQMLAAHSRIVSSGEAGLIPQTMLELSRLAPDDGRHWSQRLADIGPGGRRHLRRHYWQLARQWLPGLDEGRLLLDKTTLNTVNLGFILALFPRAPILFALRDPRDVCLSCFMQAFAPNPLTRHFLDWEMGARCYATVMDHWRAMAGSLAPDWRPLRYESLVADPQGALAPVLAWRGLDWEAAQGRFHEQARKREIATPSFAEAVRPVHAGAVGRWRAYAAHFPAVLPHLAPHLAGFGYG